MMAARAMLVVRYLPPRDVGLYDGALYDGGLDPRGVDGDRG